jgi:hypothetical protein
MQVKHRVVIRIFHRYLFNLKKEKPQNRHNPLLQRISRREILCSSFLQKKTMLIV